MLHDDDPSDFELQKGGELPPPPPDTRSPLLWIGSAVVLLLCGVGVWFYLSTGGSEPVPVDDPQTVAQAPEPPAAPDQPLGAPVEQIELPPLEESDVLVRSLVRALSTHPRVVAWLAGDDLIRSFTVAVDNVANGTVPSEPLRAFRPSGRFEVIDGEDTLVVDQRTFERYNTVADAVDSIDAQSAARLYSTLKPRIDEAYRQLGAGQPFDATLERSIVELLEVPRIEREMHLVPQGAVFAFEDPAIENLTPAQKQLARMGARNVALIQGKLRQIALALGIPAERLPSPT